MNSVSTALPAKKSLGQHFLLDMNITRKIVREAGDLSGLTVIEIGSGPGGLTRALLESTAKNIVAIEKDQRFFEALQPLADGSEGRLRLISADALEIDPVEITPGPRAIIANLPYNVGTELFTRWLQRANEYQKLVLMFQKEVAERIVAQVGDKAYGRLALLTQFCGTAKIVQHLPARLFTPPPKVDSAVIHFTPHATQPDFDITLLEKTTATAFGQRRKMLRAIFKNKLGESDFAALGIAPTARAEELPLSGFIALAKRVYQP